jgi:hypothetical protein
LLLRKEAPLRKQCVSSIPPVLTASRVGWLGD